MLKGNLIIGQSGGPTTVINASLVGVVQEARKYNSITGVFGMRWGIEGFMNDDLVDLSREDPAVIEGLKRTPSSALGSCRHKVRDEDLPRILEVIKKHNIRYFFLVGGNDTMNTIYRVEKYCREQGYELAGIGIPKTVDNDLNGTDHTPGFASAARYVALSVMQAGMLARDMQKVDQIVLYQCIGRDSGWLTAAAAAGKKDESDPPHLIYVPDVRFEKEKYLADVEYCLKKYGWVSIAVGDAILYPDGSAVSRATLKDKFGNTEFGSVGGGSSAMELHRWACEEFKIRGEFTILESLQMCAMDRVSEIDLDEAYRCGTDAVRLAAEGKTGVMVTIVRDQNKPYRSSTGSIDLQTASTGFKAMPAEFIAPSGDMVTQEYLDYLLPLIGELPDYSSLSFKK